MPSVFDQVLQISTPGFDSLVNTIQTEAERIRQNQALANKRKNRLQLSQLESDLSLSRQRKMQAEKQEDYLERLARQQELQEESAIDQTQEEIEAYEKKRAIDLELYEGKRQLDALYSGEDQSVISNDLIKKANDKQDMLYQDYETVYQQNILPEPNVTPFKDDSGTYTNIVKDNEGNIVGTFDQFRQNSSDLKVLANFMQGLQDTSNLVETTDGANITSGETLHITRANASEELQKIYNMSLSEKIDYAQRINEGRVATAPESKFGAYGVDKQGEDDGASNLMATADGRRVRKMFVNMPKDAQGLSLLLPKTFTDENKGFPVNFNMKGSNMQDVINLKSKLLQHAKDQEYLIQIEEGANKGEWKPAEDLDEQGKAAIQSLTKVRPISNLFQSYLESKASFGGRQAPKDFTINWDWNPDDKGVNLWKETETIPNEEEQVIDQDYEITKGLLGEN